jgi:3-dehydroquinate synthase
MNALESTLELFSSLQELHLYCEDLTRPYTNCAIVTDCEIHRLYPWNMPVILLPTGEKAKTLDCMEHLWKELIEKGFDRRSVLIAMGGGAICDAAGFAASCYMRGIDTVYIPTTLLGMVDAAIGGKTAINQGSHKNVIGSFHLPKKILLCSKFLESLPERELASGMAELIKTAVVASGGLFERLENDASIDLLIEQCAKIKLEIVAEDFRDQGIRAHLNWGHTVGHALEGITGYTRWLHGEAVAIGMSCEAFISWKLGYADQNFYERQNRLIQKYKLPTILPDDIDLDALVTLMKRDKKALQGKIGLILAREIGTVLSVTDLDKDILKQALKTKRDADRGRYE